MIHENNSIISRAEISKESLNNIDFDKEEKDISERGQNQDNLEVPSIIN